MKAEEKNKTGCGCGSCGHSHGQNGCEDPNGGLLRLIASGVLFAAALVMGWFFGVHEGWPDSVLEWVRFALMATAFLISGGKVVVSAIKNIFHGKFFDENFLMTIACVGSFALGEYPEAAAVMLFYQIGEYFQDYAVGRSRRSISSLMELRPDYAVVVTESGVKKVDADSVVVGSVVEVKPGERVPLDGIVESGSAFLDTSALTGEAVPRRAFVGDEVMGGFINTSGVLRIRTTKTASESAIARVMKLVEDASDKKAASEQFITRFAKVYTPIVTLAALVIALVPPVVLGGSSWAVWIERALVFLVVSCPCALVISVPLSFFAGIGAASKKGILIKGSCFMESLADAHTIVFDKTGTLTEGVFQVEVVHPVVENGFTSDELVAIAAHAEKYSSHPIAVSLKEAHAKIVCADNEEKSCDCCEKIQLVDVQEMSGQGISGVLEGKHVLAGNAKLMESNNVASFNQKTDECAQLDGGTIVHVAVDGIYVGHIVISDRVRKDAPIALKKLRENGIEEIVMLTGDGSAAAKKVGQQLGVDTVFANLLPEDKVMQVERLVQQRNIKKAGKNKRLVFVGDGINDAPVLARSDVGMAMGAFGSDAAIEAADVVLMTDDLLQIPEALQIARRTRRIVIQNIGIALGVKGAVLIFGALGFVSMWAAVFADVGVSCLAVFNSMRLLLQKNCQ